MEAPGEGWGKLSARFGRRVSRSGYEAATQEAL